MLLEMALLAAVEGGIPWAQDLASAWRDARERRTGLLIYVRGGDEEADALQEGILADPDVVAASRDVACVRLEAGEEAEALLRRLGVEGSPEVPCLLFFRNVKDTDALEQTAFEILTGSPSERVTEWMRSSLFSGSDGVRLILALVVVLVLALVGVTVMRRMRR